MGLLMGLWKRNTLSGCEFAGFHGYCDKKLKREESLHTSWNSINTAILSRFCSFSWMKIYQFCVWGGVGWGWVWLISRVLKYLTVSILPVLLILWERDSFGHSGSQLWCIRCLHVFIQEITNVFFVSLG